MKRYNLTNKQKKFYSKSVQNRIRIVKHYRSVGRSLESIARRFGVRRKTIARLWGSKLKLDKGRKSERQEGNNIGVTLYFKLTDYGEVGHTVWINCYRKCVFPDDVDNNTIDDWINSEKDNILEDNLNWFGSWIYTVDYEWGEEREFTNVSPMVLEGKNMYSHDNNIWKEFIV